jgi:hypothetical protein
MARSTGIERGWNGANNSRHAVQRHKSLRSSADMKQRLADFYETLMCSS